jgi:tetratricopeptide (TPR) repeat protein
MLSIDPEDIDAINSLGLILKKDERFELAINQFEKGIALAKKNPISAAFCVNNRAAIYAQQGKLEKALQDYTMAIELDPTNATRYESRSEFHYTFEHSVEEALEDLIRAIELDPNNERYYYLRGYFYTELKKYDLAIESYQQALRINPGMIDAINNIGVIYEQQGKTELEIENYNKCIALENTNPNSAANCYYNRARIYEQQRKLTEALQDYTKAIELDNKNGDMYSTRALFYEEYLEDYDNALIDFSKAIELAPTNVNYLYQRGVFYKETLNKNKKALDDFEKILEIDSTDIDALNYIGVILEDEGKYDLAITQYEKGIALEITNPTSAAYCYFNRADIYAKQGKLTEALQDYTKAIELDPKNAEHYFYRAEFYTNNLNKPYDALVDYSIAINKDSLATYFWWNRGKLYSEKLNNQKLAIEDFDQILKIKPNDINALNWRTIFHQRNNEIENAILGYKKIISFGDSIKKLENIIEDYGWANINLAYIYQCIDKIEEASNLFNEGVSYMPNYAEGYYYRAWFLTLYKSQFDGAINDFSTSMNLEPNNPYWLLNRSKIYHLKGDFKRAKSDINEAVKISKESAIYIAERGNYYSITGEYDKATKEIKESIKLDSTNRRTFHYLTENLIRQGKLDEALKNATTTITKFKNDTISLEQIGRINFSKNELFKSLSAYTEAASIMEFNEGFRYIYPHDIQVFLSDVDIKIAEIYEKLNQSNLQCEFLNKAKDIVIFETRPDRQKMIKEIQEKLKNCQN